MLAEDAGEGEAKASEGPNENDLKSAVRIASSARPIDQGYWIIIAQAIDSRDEYNVLLR